MKKLKLLIFLVVLGLWHCHTVPSGQQAGTMIPCFGTLQGDELSLIDNCVILKNNWPVAINKKLIGKLDFFREGLSEISIKNFGSAYVHRNGRVIVTPTMDNGPDIIEQKIFRYITQNKKMGFMDTNFNIVIKPGRWTFIYPFDDDGFAWFCKGCKEVNVDEEHKKMMSGTWGKIDRNGKVQSSKLHYQDFLNHFQE